MRRFLCTAQDEDPRVHMITVGDFTQLPPCFDKFVFEAPQLVADCNDKSEPESKSSRVRIINADQVTGFHLWRTFEIVVKLTENMRHSRDPKYGSLLRRLRVRNQTCNDFSTLNTMLIDRNDPLSNVHEELARVQERENVICPLSSQGNTSRHSINWLSMKELYDAIDKNVLRFCSQLCSMRLQEGKNQPSLSCNSLSAKEITSLIDNHHCYQCFLAFLCMLFKI